MSGYSFDTAPAALRAFLARLVGDTRDLLGARLRGIILHGSLAMGSYYPPKSDIDLLIVVDDLDEAAGGDLYDLLSRRNAARPYVAGLEVSAVRARDLERPIHPLPFLIHLGDNTAGPQPRPEGALPRDLDLVAHLMVARERGLSLVGPPPDQLIGPIDWNDYLAAVKADIDWLLSGEAIVETPRYAVLNLCRWTMMQATPRQLVPSKEEAALWALERLPPEHHAIVDHALRVYRDDADVTPDALIAAGGPWDDKALRAFRDWVRAGEAGRAAEGT
ncbi:MAG TPA: aminoglycoside adenylyltransferase domain-containing protein [Caulobacteraceae bacterium]|nr:aminoglycoside adenylyltransferase domain-containing protein [Caulobacteraceae bacterium]